MKKLLSVLAAVLLLLSLFSACGGSSNTGAQEMAKPEEPAGDALYGESSVESGADTLPENRKLVKTVYLDAETKDMDTLLVQLDAQVSELGGYMEERSVHNGSSYSSSQYRSASMVIRIPADKVDAFIENMEGFSNIVSSNQTVEDITLNYVATESRVTALQTEESRLLELMENAETMADLLEIEARLTDVRYELENYASQLRLYDNQVNYATVYLDISQVQELTEPEPESFWERISTGFVNSLKNLWDFCVELVIALIIGSPYLAVIGSIVVCVVLLSKRRRKKKPVKKQPPAPNDPTK